MPHNFQVFIVRFPINLHAKVKTTAIEARRSMNSEIIERLERSFNASQMKDSGDSVQILLLQEIERLKKIIRVYE